MLWRNSGHWRNDQVRVQYKKFSPMDKMNLVRVRFGGK